jgi:glycosyltransferase involved in cell wall biosynthesis
MYIKHIHLLQRMITAIIPAYNEEKRIGKVVREAKRCVDEVLVIDDNSTDRTAHVATRAGAKVITNANRKGYIGALQRGFKNAGGETIVTIDGDGEHDPKEIPKLIQPIVEERADLTLGQREKITRPSERLLNWLANFGVQVTDSGTGFRALKKDLALQLTLNARCICGVFVLESTYLGARIAEVPISIRSIDKKRGIAWYHLHQLFYVLKWLLKLKNERINLI